MFFRKRRAKSEPADVVRAIIQAAPVLFDETAYVKSYPEVSASGLSAQEHFATIGAFQDFQPHTLFDPVFYRSQCGNSLKGSKSAFLHYFTGGWRKNLKPHLLFDPDYYLRYNPTVREQGCEPLQNYLEQGWRKGYAPHSAFDPEFYLCQYADIATAQIEPLQHYLNHGAGEGRKPSPHFDPTVYVRDHADEGVDLSHALLHFVRNDPAGVAKLDRNLERLKISGQALRVDQWAQANGGKVIRLVSAPSITWTSPNITNRPVSRHPLTGNLPPQYIAVLENTKIIPGTRIVITADGSLLHDEMAEDPENQYHPKLQSIRRFDNPDAEPYVLYDPSQKFGKALYISSDTDWNYFHWLVEALPKLSLAEKAGIPASIPCLVQSGLHVNHMDALKRVLGKRPYIEHEPNVAIQVGTLWYISDMSRVLDNVQSVVRPDYDIVVSRDAVAWMHEHLAVKSLTQGRKIYVERASNYRLLVNEAQLIASLKEIGFETVNTSRLTLDEQISLFSQSRLIVSPTGAAMTNLMFCQPGAHALILVAENSQSNLNIFNHVGDAVGVEVSYCLGSRAFTRNDIHTVHDDFSIDISSIVDWCAAKSKEAPAYV